MNKHNKLIHITRLLDQSLEEAHQFVQEVNQALPNCISYGKIFHATRSLPLQERTAQKVAEYLK